MSPEIRNHTIPAPPEPATALTLASRARRAALATGLSFTIAAGVGGASANAQSMGDGSPQPTPPGEVVPAYPVPTPEPAAPASPAQPSAYCAGKKATIVGTNEDDVIKGTNGDDVISGLNGNDTIQGLGGNDIVCGGTGHDVIWGGRGNDKIFGQSGNDRVFGESGNDKVNGDAGHDLVDAGSGKKDKVYGGKGNDELIGSRSARLSGNKGKDWCRGARKQINCETNRGMARASGTGTKAGTGNNTFTYTVKVERGIAESTQEFAKDVEAIIGHPDGWTRTGRAFKRVPKNGQADIILATPDTVDRICARDGLDTEGKVSCQQGRDLIINLNRWRYAVPHWPKAPDERSSTAGAGMQQITSNSSTRDVKSYRYMVMNHELGHRLGLGHPPKTFRCKGSNTLAPVMLQQTYFLKGCKANWVPFSHEINAAR